MDNSWLADYLENNLVKDVLKSNSLRRTGDTFLSHWLGRLRGSEKLASHEWNNLANLISMSGQIIGKNYYPALSYCKERGAV
jgi:hypothetical protein